MGEADFAQSQTRQVCQQTIEQYEQIADEALRVQTLGGLKSSAVEHLGQSNRHGSARFFLVEFLQPSSLFENWRHQRGDYCSKRPKI